MLKILRLTHDQARTWRQNQLFLVDEAGKIIRPASQEESDEWSRYQALGNDLQLKLEDDRMVSFCSARAMLKAAILAEHGDTQIRWPNGIIIVTVRDPNRQRMSLEESQKTAPSPPHCDCKDWGDPHPTRHHPVCQWNRYAPESERGDVRAASFVPGQPVVMSVSEIQKKVAPVAARLPVGTTPSPRVFSAPIAPPAPSIPPPLQCECKEWLSPDGTPPSQRKGHHPNCQFYTAWNALHPEPSPEPATQVQQESVPPPEPSTESTELPGETQAPSTPAAEDSTYYLYMADSRQELRPALPAEIEEAQKNIEASGTPTLFIDDVLYIVATRTTIGSLPT